MNGRPHVTLEDVATVASVSLATASRVLNGTTNVREDLRERVLSAAADLAYAPNVHAQALAGATRRTVGVVCHDVDDPSFAAVARGVMRVADEHGFLVMLASTFHDPEKEIAYVSELRAQRASTIVLIGSGFEDRRWEKALSAELDAYRRGGGRVAAVSRHHGVKVDTVQPENRSGAKDLAAAMLGLGHRRFAVLAGPRELTTSLDRLTGFREGLAEGGVELSEKDVFETEFTRDGGYFAATELLSSGHSATCVFAVSDVMAIGALSALREAGRSVPDDVSLAGFDDISVTRDVNPSLTTVALPLARLGEQAMELALNGNSGNRAKVRRIAGEVVLRDSTSRPRRRR
ncbi:LacI family transcriptional regulator [Amycolatopsis sp. K13G38]|uniref:LacI family transcriptional regulator n=1 Tax=Amycolatopsis acididurans TaxID=2724524 RepID=A0ABX1J5G6_9PSEU|nr:LacI family DNA-binding transcriptional regulator [Amycolatopsis acididurans]NKQ54174.1 LacI family transcriptional regulator [Amycolatopsis acididurans]